MRACYPKVFSATAAVRIGPEQVKTWADIMTAWLKVHAPGHALADVKTGSDAWSIASRSGVLTEAYKDRTMTDAHIQTALEKIFLNATFGDKKRY